jgi:hypothetical protein
MKHVEDMTKAELEGLMFDNKGEEWIIDRAVEIQSAGYGHPQLVELAIDIASQELAMGQRIDE